MAEDEGKDEEMNFDDFETIQFTEMAEHPNDSVYAAEETEEGCFPYPLYWDETGSAFQFLKYRARVLSAMKPGDFDPESIRVGLTQTLHNGGWLCLDFDKIDAEIDFSDKEMFGENFDLFNSFKLYNEEFYSELVKKGDHFAGAVQYSATGEAATGAFQDRTKATAPEECVDVDSTFEPKEAFRLIITTTNKAVLERLKGKVQLFKINIPELGKDEEPQNAMWGGDAAPADRRTKDQQKIDTEYLESAFEGSLDDVKKYLEQGADPFAVDARGHDALSEAAVASKDVGGKEHMAIVDHLLTLTINEIETGLNPNAQDKDGRTSLHRAAFDAGLEMVTKLLEAGADPAIKDNDGETAIDKGNAHPEVQALLAEWVDNEENKTKTKEAKDVYKAKFAVYEESLVKDAAGKKALEKKRIATKLLEFVDDSEVDLLEMELIGLDEKTALSKYRDERGNTVMHKAAQFEKIPILEAIYGNEDFSAWKPKVDVTDDKGWTPLQVAAFHKHKKVVEFLLSIGANPEKTNSYRKNAIDLCEDDEIKTILTSRRDCGAEAPPPEEHVAGSGANAVKAVGKAKAKGKAKGKAKAKAKA